MTDICLEEGIIHTGIDPAINFDIVKWIMKNIHT